MPAPFCSPSTTLTFWLGADGRLYHSIIEIIRGKEQPPLKVLLRRK